MTCHANIMYRCFQVMQQWRICSFFPVVTWWYRYWNRSRNESRYTISRLYIQNRKIQHTQGRWFSNAFSHTAWRISFHHLWCHFAPSRNECMYVTLYLWVFLVFGSSHWQSMSQNNHRTIYIIVNFSSYHMIAVMTLCWSVALSYICVL